MPPFAAFAAEMSQGCAKVRLFSVAGVVIFLMILWLAGDARRSGGGAAWKWLVVLVGVMLSVAMLSVGIAKSQQPYSYRPAKGPAAKSHPVQTGYYDTRFREILILEAVDTVFDLNAKDVFVFRGPVEPAQGVVVGVRPDGSEARYGAPQVPAGTPKDQAQPAKAQAQLASLTASCAACHTAGVKTRGNFTLFDEKGEVQKGAMKRALARILDKDDPMPPASSGKPRPTQQDIDALATLTK